MRDELYFEQRKLSQRYSSIPSNELSVSRLIQVQPPFRHQELDGQKKPKKLIVSHHLENKSVFEKYIFACQLINLQREGFEIYFVTDGTTLIQWKDQETNCIKLQYLIETVFPQLSTSSDIKRYAQELDCTGDEIYLFDESRINKFIQGHPDEIQYYKHLENGCLSLESCPLNLQQFKQLIEENRDDIKTLSLSDCRFLLDSQSDIQEDLFNQGLAQLEELEIDLSYDERKNYDWDLQQTIALISKIVEQSPRLNRFKFKCPNIYTEGYTQIIKLMEYVLKKAFIKDIEYCGPKIVLEDCAEFKLEQLESFNGGNNFLIVQSIYERLSHNTQIKSLFFAVRDSFNMQLPLPKSIQFVGVDVVEQKFPTIITLPVFLKETIVLSKLELINCEIIPWTTSELPRLNSLEELNLSSSSINTESLGQLLLKSPNLKKLNLSSCTKISRVLDEISQLNNLEEMDFSASSINTKSLEQLLSKSPNLKKLNLSYCKEIYGVLDEISQLNNLEEMDFSYSSVNTESLEQLLSKSPNLKKLNLSFCKKISGDLSRQFALSRLEELNLSSSSINTESLGQLLSRTRMPNLRKLKLSDCQSISGVLGEISELSNLEEMDFSASSINTKSLEQLLSKSPNLKKLNLTCCKLDLFGCRNVSGALGELHRLNSLEELNLSYSSINTELLGQLLSKMPNLKKLDLFGCRNISEALGEISEFKNLEVLDLSKSSINAESLGQLLSKMPNLKKLNLIDDMYLQKEKYEFQNKEEIECFIQKLRLQTKTENTPTFFQRMGSLVYNKSQLPPSDEQLSNHQPFQKTAASNETTKHHQSKAAVDADTKPPNSNLSVKKEFIRKTQRTHENVHPRNVRHDCFERLAFQDAKVPFLVLADAEKDIEVFIEATKSNQSLLPDFEKASVGSYLGRFSITLNHEWQPLPSVMPHETLKSYFCDINVDIEIAYSEQKNFYYVRLPSSVQQTSILSTIEVLLTPDAREVALPPEVQKISQTISKFGEGQLNTDYCKSGKDFIEAIIKQKLGACRHRAIAFKYQMQEQHPDIPVRIVTNDCHAFVEVFYPGKWIQIDLGGYNSRLEYKEDLFQKELKPKQVLHQEGAEAISAQRQKPQALIDFGHFSPKSQTKLSILGLLALEKKKIFIETTNVSNLRQALQDTCQRTGRTFYYIDHPDELHCTGPFIRRHEDMRGEVVSGPGGALYDYLTTNDNPILILNLSRFKTSDFVQYNSLFDDEPRLEGLPILERCKIIGLSDVAIPQDASITSRFEIKNEIDAEGMPRMRLSEKASGHVIECYGGLEWESRLIGAWMLHGQALSFKKGLIWEAIEQGSTKLVFNHPPLHDQNFVRLMEDLRFHHGLYYQGELLVNVDAPLDILFTNSAPLLGQEPVIFEEGSKIEHVLNPETMADFIGKYHFQSDTQMISPKPGLIEENQHNVIPVYLTAALSSAQWQLLRDSCRKHDTKLNITAAPGVLLPEGMKASQLQLDMCEHTQCVNDLPTGLDDALYVDISELTTDALLPNLERVDGAPEAFIFREKDGFLTQALNEGKTVILSGDWSKAKSLEHLLHPFVFRRMQDEALGKLILVQNEQKAFSFMSPILYQGPKPEPAKIYRKVGLQERQAQVAEVLRLHPLVILTGPTGVGKTHFVNTSYPDAHFGEERILDWINDEKQPILFIDEANMSFQDWSMFEGLFQEPPGIFYQGQYHRLSPHHRVIFAANPLSYGGERKQPSLFRNHPLELEFEPLTAKELLEALKVPEKIAHVITPMMNFIFQLDSHKVLLTPREILMVVQIVQALGDAHTKSVAYSMFKTHVPLDKQRDFEKEFKPEQVEHFKPTLKSLVINDSNQAAVDAICQHLAVRQIRQGGLGGVILEGEPGVGKSQLVAQLLSEAYSLKEGLDFIRIPVSLSYEKKQALLLSAFHQGQIVIIDEINASPMMERELNALLEGHDLNNNPAEKPGFMIIGTQNPASYCGRVQTTLPLKHRLQTVEIKEYTTEEMKVILMHLGLSEDKAIQLIKYYQSHKKSKELCFRDLLRAAKSIQESMQESVKQTLGVMPAQAVDEQVLSTTILGELAEPMQKSVKQTLPEFDQLREKFKQRCEAYVKKLEASDVNDLAGKKNNFFKQALGMLNNQESSSREAIAAALQILGAQKTLLSIRRDSWLIGVAKIGLSLGTILVYRWFLNDEVTESVRILNEFSQKFRALTSPSGPSAQSMFNAQGPASEAEGPKPAV